MVISVMPTVLFLSQDALMDLIARHIWASLDVRSTYVYVVFATRPGDPSEIFEGPGGRNVIVTSDAHGLVELAFWRPGEMARIEEDQPAKMRWRDLKVLLAKRYAFSRHGTLIVFPSTSPPTELSGCNSKVYRARDCAVYVCLAETATLSHVVITQSGRMPSRLLLDA